jgi:hypothetical protein
MGNFQEVLNKFLSPCFDAPGGARPSLIFVLQLE